MSSEGERRLAVIVFTDVVGFTSLSQRNEALAMDLLEEHRKILRPIFRKYGGKEVNMMGDAFLVEFGSALEAVKCSLKIQSTMKEKNANRPDERRIFLRIGIHLGDVIHKGKQVSGDAVNLASRIEPLALPGGVCLTAQVYSSVVNKVECGFESIGNPHLKNVLTPIEVFRVSQLGEDAGRATLQVVAPPKNRIAVLPLVNISPDPDDSYFADGITEEIISTISSVSGLTVTSRTSVMGYKGTTKKVGEIGRELVVGSILEGSFRKAGNKIRVTCQLIDVSDDSHVWSQSYERELNDIFAIQTEIAKHVANSLRVSILSPEMDRIFRKPTENMTAYSLYLKGRYLWNKRGRGVADLRDAAEYFEQSIKRDPNFAPGYVGLADCYELLAEFWLIHPGANHEKAKAMVARALELDPQLAETHATRGLLLSNDFRFREAEDEERKAIELKPSFAPAHLWYFRLLLYQLRWDEAFEQIERAVELDPFSPPINHNRAFFYVARREYAKGLELYKKVVELDPGYLFSHLNMIPLYAGMNRFEEAFAEAKICAELLRDSHPLFIRMMTAFSAAMKDDKQTVRDLLPELTARIDETFMGAYGIAILCLSLHQKDKAFEWLERSYLRREPFISLIKSDRFMDGIREDPRYLGLLKRIELG